MVRILTKEEFLLKKDVFINKLKKSVFIYPTDTIYGIGCDASNPDMISRLRKIKGRKDLPLSVIPPSIDWVERNCIISARVKRWLKKLPGPYTLILKLKRRHNIPLNLNNGRGTIGIRFPDCWFTNIVKGMNVPVVTTSANKKGEIHMTSLDDLNPEIAKNVDYIIFDGEIKGSPSTLVHLEKIITIVKKRD